MKKKNAPQKLPAGWTLQDVQDLAAYYDSQSDAEGAAEIESSKVEETLMFIPWKLVPRVRSLLKQHETKPKPRRQKSPTAA
jgi:hypothetical protein